MKREAVRVPIYLIILISIAFSTAHAGASPKKQDIASSLKLICAVSNYYTCEFEGGCQEVQATEINAPRFFMIDLHKKTVSPIGAGAKKDKKSNIVSMVNIGKIMVLQGVEDGETGKPDGVGWTASINITNGNLALSASGLDAAFVGLGACTALDSPVQP